MTSSTSSEPAPEAVEGPRVEVRGLEKVYRFYDSPADRIRELLGGPPRHRAHRVLSGIDFALQSGECLGLLGHNGSGKSTLLRILAGASHPTSGVRSVRGKVSTLLDLGAGFHPDLSGHRNLDHAAVLLGLSRDEFSELRPKIEAFAGLGEAMHDPVRTYSTGMTMRLGFSLAVHVPFDVLLIDEVLLVGDELFQRRSLRRVRELLDERKTIVLASHSLGDLTAVCNKLLLLEHGRQSLLGSTDEVIRAYLEDSERQARRISEGDRLLHDSRVPQETVGNMKLTGVDLLGPGGESAGEFRSGEPMSIRISYRAESTVHEPVFRVQFFRNDGLWIMGTNTVRGNLDLGRVEGEGSVTVQYDSMNLLDGDYHVSVGIWPDEYPSYLSRAPFDLHDRSYVLRVRSGRPEGGGTVFCPHRWTKA